MILLTDEQATKVREHICPSWREPLECEQEVLSILDNAQSVEVVGQLSRWPEHPPTFSEKGYGNAEILYAIKEKK